MNDKKIRYPDYFGGWKNLVKWSSNNASELMQNIGIKDVNGKEIFEGDIIMAYNELAIIEYCEGAYEIISIRNEYLGRFCSASTIIEVKGNIYENPELINNGGEDK